MTLEEAIERAHDALDEDRAAEAITILVDALASSEDDSPEERADALGLASIAARVEGRDRDARQWSDEAIAIAEASEDSARLIPLLEDRAELELALRATGSAQELLRRAISLREASGDEDAETWLALAEALLRGGELAEALAALARVAPLAAASGDQESATLAEEMRGDVALAMPDGARAREAYTRARDAWRAMGEDAAVVRCVVGEARAAELEGDADGVERALGVLEGMEEGVEGREEAVEEVRGLR